MNASKAYLVNNAGGGGGGGAFWNNPSGKVVISLDWNNDGQTKGQNTGIILTPTPGVWSVYQWQFDSIRFRQSYTLLSSILSGFIIFAPDAGTPAARFGAGAGDPGFGSPQGFNEEYTTPYNFGVGVVPESPGFGQGLGFADVPIDILATSLTTGEVRFSMYDTHATANPMGARGVLTISPELLFAAPLLGVA